MKGYQTPQGRILFLEGRSLKTMETCGKLEFIEQCQKAGVAAPSELFVKTPQGSSRNSVRKTAPLFTSRTTATKPAITGRSKWAEGTIKGKSIFRNGKWVPL